MKKRRGYRVATDIGGTFTDIVLMDDQSRIVGTAKTPTSPEALA